MFGLSNSEKRLKALEESVEGIERAVKKLQLEWDETYDKFRQLHWRVSKRAKQLEQAPETETAQPAGGEENPQAPSLSDRQSDLQRKILERRSRIMSVRREQAS